MESAILYRPLLDVVEMRWGFEVVWKWVRVPEFPMKNEQDIDLLQASALMRVNSLVEIDFRNWWKLGFDVELSVLDRETGPATVRLHQLNRGTAPRILVRTN
jgi:hypothetical protein